MHPFSFLWRGIHIMYTLFFLGLSEQAVKRLKTFSRLLQGMLYMGASLFHFVTDAELQIIPACLPLRRTALYITGACEFLGGMGLLIPRFRRAASWGLAALLLAIWPANIYHAIIEKRSGDWQKHRFYHLARQPMQMALIVWVLWSTQQD